MEITIKEVNRLNEVINMGPLPIDLCPYKKKSPRDVHTQKIGHERSQRKPQEKPTSPVPLSWTAATRTMIK